MSAAADTAAALRELANRATANGVMGRATELTPDEARLLHRAADLLAPLPTFASVDAAFDREFGNPLAGIAQPKRPEVIHLSHEQDAPLSGGAR